MATEGKSLKARAADLLSRREHTRRELKRRLAPYADSEAELEALLDELAQNRWQSDSRFAEAFAASRAAKYGSARIKQEMRQRGVDDETIRAALSGQDELPAARAAWQKKFGKRPENAQEKARQYRFLAARGFSMDIIRKVLGGAFDDE